MALLHEARGEFDLAISEYRKEQETAPFNHKPDFNLGLLYMKFKRIDEAIKEFESCIKKNEAFAGGYVFLSKAYMDSSKSLYEAEKLARRGLSLKADTQTMILGHFVLADILNRQGKSSEAQNHVNQAKELQKKL